MGKYRLTARQVEKAGLGMAIWQLSRRGLEVQQTSDCSHQGDLWVKAPGKHILRVEVKAASQKSFHIRSKQTHHCDVFILVAIHTAKCWVLTAPDFALDLKKHKTHSDGTIYVSIADLPENSADAWHHLTGLPDNRVSHRSILHPSKTERAGILPSSHSLRADRVVRRKMRDGTVKTYRYGPYVKAIPVSQQL